MKLLSYYVASIALVLLSPHGTHANPLGYAEFRNDPPNIPAGVYWNPEGLTSIVGALLWHQGELFESVPIGSSAISPPGEQYSAIGFNAQTAPGLGPQGIYPLVPFGLDIAGGPAEVRVNYAPLSFGALFPLTLEFGNDVASDTFTYRWTNSADRAMSVRYFLGVFAADGLFVHTFETVNLDANSETTSVLGGCANARCPNDHDGPRSAFIWAFEVGSGHDSLADTFGAFTSDFGGELMEFRLLSVVPEPGTLSLFALGVAGIGFLRRTHQRRGIKGGPGVQTGVQNHLHQRET